MKKIRTMLAIGLVFSLTITSGMIPYAQQMDELNTEIVDDAETVETVSISSYEAGTEITENSEHTENTGTTESSATTDSSETTENTEPTETTEPPSTEIVEPVPDVYRLEGLPENVSLAKDTDYQLPTPSLRINNNETLVAASSVSYSVISGSEYVSVSDTGIIHGIWENYSCAQVNVSCIFSLEGKTEPVVLEQVVNVYVSNPYVDDSEYSFNYYTDTNRYIGLFGINQYSQVTVTTSDENLSMREVSYGDSIRLYYFEPKQPGTYTITLNVDGVEIICHAELKCVYLKYNSKSVTSRADKKWRDNDTVIALYPGERTKLIATGLADDVSVFWSCDNSFVTVTEDGTITGVSYGDSVITAQYGEYTFRYKVSVGPKVSIKALRYAAKNFNSTYSQKYRMSEGKYDCSSYVWRSYKDAKLYVGSTTYAPTAAGQAKWAATNGYVVYAGTVNVKDLLPGDLVYWTGKNNGRYLGIYHVDMYVGNGKLITVPREKTLGETITKCVVVRPSDLSKVTSPKLTYKKTKKTSTITLNWNSVYGAKGYQVYRKEKKEKSYKKIKTVNGTTQFVDNTVKKGKTYSYKIRPYWYNKIDKTKKYGRYSSIVSKKVSK